MFCLRPANDPGLELGREREEQAGEGRLPTSLHTNILLLAGSLHPVHLYSISLSFFPPRPDQKRQVSLSSLSSSLPPFLVLFPFSSFISRSPSISAHSLFFFLPSLPSSSCIYFSCNDRFLHSPSPAPLMPHLRTHTLPFIPYFYYTFLIFRYIR